MVLAGERVDEAATAALRAAARDEADATRSSTSGRRAASTSAAGRRRCKTRSSSMLMSLPAPYRAYVRRTLYPRVAALAASAR